MAGVIASVSLHSKEGKNPRASPISTSKSNYIIRQFDRTFTPSKHNIFLVRRADMLERARHNKNKGVMDLDLYSYREDENTTMSVSRLLCEIILLSMFLSFRISN